MGGNKSLFVRSGALALKHYYKPIWEFWLFRIFYAEIETIILYLPLIAGLLGSFRLDFVPKAQNPSSKAIFLAQQGI
jgi:hypothetical protein